MSTAELADIVGVGLPGAAPLAEEPLDDDRWISLLTTAANERATGMLYHAVLSGALAATATQREALSRVHELELADCLRLEGLLAIVGDALDANDVEWRLLKGPGFAYRFYPAPTWRTFGDIDLLVRGRDWDRVAALLHGADFDRRYHDPRPGFTARFGKGACFVSPVGLEIDLHRTFVAGPFGLGFDADALFARCDLVTIAAREIATLDAAGQAVHAALHAVLGSERPRLVALRDLAQILVTGTDAEAVRARAQEWGVGYPVSRAVLLARTLLGLRAPLPLESWAAGYVPDTGERRALGAYASPQRSYAAQALAGVAALRGVRPRLAYMRALAFPTSGYLDARDEGAPRRLLRATRLARSWHKR